MFYFRPASKYILLLLFCSGCARLIMCSEVTITIHVVDDSDIPIEGALVKWTWNGQEFNSPINAIGTTDKNGDASQAVRGAPCLIISKEGYYSNGISENDEQYVYKSPFFRTNQPPVSVKLKRKLHPAPMFIRNLDSATGRLPIIGMPCGYDMMIGDWVPPYGKGIVSDFIATLKFEVRKHFDLDYRGEIIFPNIGDGVILFPVKYRFRVSELRLPPEAPADGYQNSLIWNVVFGSGPVKFAIPDAPRSPGPQNRTFEDDNYFIRIRTKKAADGTESGIYGKIHGEIELGIGPINDISFPKDAKPAIQFLYYLNPDETRHIEWDKVHNLAGGSKIPIEP